MPTDPNFWPQLHTGEMIVPPKYAERLRLEARLNASSGEAHGAPLPLVPSSGRVFWLVMAVALTSSLVSISACLVLTKLWGLW